MGEQFFKSKRNEKYLLLFYSFMIHFLRFLCGEWSILWLRVPLRTAWQTSTQRKKRKKLGQITAITGFALKFNHLRDNLMLWHDVTNDCLTSHSIEDLIKNLEDRKHHIRAILGNWGQGSQRGLSSGAGSQHLNFGSKTLFSLKISYRRCPKKFYQKAGIKKR